MAELLVAILLVRLLSPPEWASIALLLSFYAAAIGLGGFGLAEGMLFFLGRTPRAEHRRFVWQTTWLLALSGALAAALMLTLAVPMAGAPFQVGGLLPLLALAVLLEIPALAAPQLLVAEERIGGAAAFHVAGALLRLAAVSGPILLGAGVRGAVVGLVVTAALRLLTHVILVLQLTPPAPLAPAWTSVREQLAFTAPLGLAICATALNGGLGKWFVALWAPDQLGAYAIAATQVPIIPILAVATGTVLATRMVHAFRHGLLEQAAAYWRASTARMVLLVAPITIGIVLGAPQLLELLFGARYATAVLPFQIGSLVLLHRLADNGGTLRAAGDTGSLWRSSLLLLASNAAFGIPLTLGFGMVGTAIALVAATLVAWVYVLSRIARAMGERLATVLPWRLYAGVLTLAGVAALAALGVARFAPASPLVQLAVRWGLFLALFVAGARALGMRRRLPAVPGDHASFRVQAA